MLVAAGAGTNGGILIAIAGTNPGAAAFNIVVHGLANITVNHTVVIRAVETMVDTDGKLHVVQSSLVRAVTVNHRTHRMPNAT